MLFAYSYYIVHIFISNNISGSAVSNWTNDIKSILKNSQHLVLVVVASFDTLLYWREFNWDNLSAATLKDDEI